MGRNRKEQNTPKESIYAVTSVAPTRPEWHLQSTRHLINIPPIYPSVGLSQGIDNERIINPPQIHPSQELCRVYLSLTTRYTLSLPWLPNYLSLPLSGLSSASVFANTRAHPRGQWSSKSTVHWWPSACRMMTNSIRTQSVALVRLFSLSGGVGWLVSDGMWSESFSIFTRVWTLCP